jgi:hypothetical protein
MFDVRKIIEIQFKALRNHLSNNRKRSYNNINNMKKKRKYPAVAEEE